MRNVLWIALVPALAQVGAPRDSIAVAADAATIVIAVGVLVVLVMLGLLFLRLNRVLGELRSGVRQSLGPVSERARAISDNVEFISQVVRSDVESLDASVRALADRLTLASDRMEERIEEFNALMEVVQEEAEEIFLDTASTVRGVREGARSIAGSRHPSDAGDPEGDRPDAGAGRRPALATAEDVDDRSDGAV